MTQRIFNAPSYSFLVQVSDQKGNPIQYHRYDQYVKPPCREASVTRVRNAIERVLHGLHERHGLNYYIIAEAPVLELDDIIAAQNIEVI